MAWSAALDWLGSKVGLSGREPCVNRQSKVVVLGDEKTGKYTLLRALAAVASQCGTQWKVECRSESPALFEYSVEYPVRPSGMATAFLSKVTVSNRNDPFPSMQIESSTAAIVCFSLVDRNTFINACNKWIRGTAELASFYSPIILVGLKQDLRDREVKERKHKHKPTSESEDEPSEISEHLALIPCEDGVSPVDLLPSEVLMRVFDHLSTSSLLNCMLVSKKWSRIIKHPYLWLHRSKGVVLRKEGREMMQQYPTILSYHEISLPSDDIEEDAAGKGTTTSADASSPAWLSGAKTSSLPTKQLTRLLREIVRTAGCSGDPTSFSILGVKRTDLEQYEQRQHAKHEEKEPSKETTPTAEASSPKASSSSSSSVSASESAST